MRDEEINVLIVNNNSLEVDLNPDLKITLAGICDLIAMVYVMENDSSIEKNETTFAEAFEFITDIENQAIHLDKNHQAGSNVGKILINKCLDELLTRVVNLRIRFFQANQKYNFKNAPWRGKKLELMN